MYVYLCVWERGKRIQVDNIVALTYVALLVAQKRKFEGKTIN